MNNSIEYHVHPHKYLEENLDDTTSVLVMNDNQCNLYPVNKRAWIVSISMLGGCDYETSQ